MQLLPEVGFLRLSQILGQKAISAEQAAHNKAAGRRGRRQRDAQPGLLNISSTKWWQGIARGTFPRPIKLGRSSLWRVEDIRALIEQLGRKA